MCRWMGSHFHGGINYNVVDFLLELLEWERTFSGFGRSENSGRCRSKNGSFQDDLVKRLYKVNA